MLKNKNGNSSVVGFLIILPIALSLAINPIFMTLDVQKYAQLDDIAKKYIIKMETEGGLTQESYSSLISDIFSLGFTDVNVSYSPYPMNFGQVVRIKITAKMKFRRISLTGGLKSEEKLICVGPYESISKNVSEEQ